MQNNGIKKTDSDTENKLMCCLFLETAVEMWFYYKVLLPY